MHPALLFSYFNLANYLKNKVEGYLMLFKT